MTNIPQTFTMVDSQMEHKRLRDEIAQLKMEREIADRETKQAINARDLIYKNQENDTVNSKNENIVLEKIRENLQIDISARKEHLKKLSNDINTKVEEKNTTEGILEVCAFKLETCKERINKILEDISIETSKHNSFLKEKSDEENAVNSHIVSLYCEVQKLEDQKKKYDIEYENKNNEILENEQRLATKESDLNIYELRLRQKCAELYQDMEIIL